METAAPRRRWDTIGSDVGFFAVLLLVALLLYRTVRPVLVPVLLGASVAVLVWPISARLAARTGDRRRLAAATTTLGVVLLVVVPVALLAWNVARELLPATSGIAARLERQGAIGILGSLPIPRRLRESVSDADLSRLAEVLVAQAGHIAAVLIATASHAVVGAFLFLVALYYFLLDGQRWLTEVERLLPIDRRYVRAFAREFDAVSHALFVGSLLTACIQGTAAGLGYWLFGVPQPALWGAATALVSFFPMVGTSLVWVPLAIVVAASGSPYRGLGIGLWGMLVTGTIDNLFRPLLMRGRMHVHPLLVFLSIVGGILAFGIVGLLVGPLAATLFLAALRIYDRDYRGKLWARTEVLPRH